MSEGHSDAPALPEIGWAEQDWSLLDRCGDPDCPRNDCARGSFVDVRVYIGEAAGVSPL